MAMISRPTVLLSCSCAEFEGNGDLGVTRANVGGVNVHHIWTVIHGRLWCDSDLDMNLDVHENVVFFECMAFTFWHGA